MRRVERRPKARFDLLGISNYIAENGGEARAERYLRRINDAISYLAQHPMMGLARPEVEAGIRSFPCDQHLSREEMNFVIQTVKEFVELHYRAQPVFLSESPLVLEAC